MGNRGNVVFTNGEDISPNVYLHWNGGPESVYRFLDELDRREVRADADYECARFCQIVGEFFDSDGPGSLSLGIVNGPDEITLAGLALVRTDDSDNGFYVVNRLGPTREVRRFTSYPAFHELSAMEVETERAAAYAETRYDEIAAYFPRLHGSRAQALA